MLITAQQKLDAWRWLVREAMAGNANAVAVIVDWSDPPQEDDDPLDEIAVTFQWWLDAYERRPAAMPGLGVVPPIAPSLKKVCSWISDIYEAIIPYPHTEYAENLAQIARCLAMLCEHRNPIDKTPYGPIVPPVWPTAPVLRAWITALKAKPPFSQESDRRQDSLTI